MSQTCDWRAIIDAHYAAGSQLRDILEGHSRQVADMALDIARRMRLDLDPDSIEAAAMLHDIGVVRTNAPGIQCFGTEPYLMHGVIGAEMLREDGAPEWVASVAERHTGAGLTREDVVAAGMPDPGHDLLPRTQLERLVCYSDKFFSKTHVGATAKPLERVRASLVKFGPAAASRFEALHREFSS